MSEKQYHIKPSYKPDKVKRPRKSAHSSRLPYWLAKQPFVQKFSRLSRKRKLFLLGWSGGSVLVLLTLFTTVYFANTLGSKDRIMNRNKTGVTLVDQNNTEFYTFYNAHSSTYVPLANISPNVKQAALSSEDKDFYKHAGFSPLGIGNALWQNVRPGGLDNGGSTITQQLVKTALLSEERSYVRKYQELVLSVEIERRYSKDEILEMYLNSVYFGEGAFGIEDAAKIYFGKSASQLSLSESALLIGLLPAPSAYSPISGDPVKAKSRQTYVLGRMEKDGYITPQSEKEALSQSLSYSTATKSKISRAPHFALMVKSDLEKKYGEEKIARSGYIVKTSLNLDTQTKAESAVSAQVAKLARSNVTNGSAVVIDPKTGEVRALVGSADWNNEQFGKFNIATANRQPGSSFKPIVYGTGIENKKFSAATIFEDKATDFGGYAPKNYDLRYRGNVTLRRALSNSLNIPAVSALQKTGISTTIAEAKKLGITTLQEDNDYGLPMALGTAPAKLLEMTNAYATFANQGNHNDIALISSITNKDKKVIFTNKPKNTRAISAQTSYILSSVLSDNTARSELFGSSLNLSGGRLGAVKTGTTEDYKDAWTIGYTPSISVGVWIGNNDSTAMSRVAGSSGAAPIWKSILQQSLQGTPNESFPIPTGLTQRSICRSSGALAESGGSNTMTEYFIPGTLPTQRCNENKPVEQPKVIKPEENDESETQQNNNSNNGGPGATNTGGSGQTPNAPNPPGNTNPGGSSPVNPTPNLGN